MEWGLAIPWSDLIWSDLRSVWWIFSLCTFALGPCLWMPNDFYPFLFFKDARQENDQVLGSRWWSFPWNAGKGRSRLHLINFGIRSWCHSGEGRVFLKRRQGSLVPVADEFFWSYCFFPVSLGHFLRQAARPSDFLRLSYYLTPPFPVFFPNIDEWIAVFYPPRLWLNRNF